MSLRTPSPSADLATRETRSLCNRLAESNFDSIASQILALVNGSAGEGDCKTLFVVIEVCVRSAVSQPERSGLYARLCRRLMEDISPEVHADVSGQSIGGPQLFRKVLLNRLQGDFETGYLPSPPGVECTKKRTYLGLVRFLTEIFKVQMLTERIMHECIKKALQTLEYPLEDDMEAVYILLHFAGSLLDSLKARPHMDVYFSRLRELTLDGKIPNRIRFMFQDLCDLRTRKWIPLDKGYSEDIILTPLDPDPEGERYVSDKILSQHINCIFGANDTERGLACLHPDYVPTLIKLLVQHAASVQTERMTSRAVRFLQSGSSQDLFLTSAVRLGFVMALEELQIESDAIPHLRSMVDGAGLDGEWGEEIMERALGYPSQCIQETEEEDGEDGEYIRVNPPGAAETFIAISAALYLSKPTVGHRGQVRRVVFDDWLSAITELYSEVTRERQETRELQSKIRLMSTQHADSLEKERAELTCQQQKIRELQSEIESMSTQLAKSREKIQKVEQERDAEMTRQWQEMLDQQSEFERMSSQLAKSLARIQKLEQERDVMEMARNSEQMRRLEVEERLRARQAESTTLQKDLLHAQGRFSELEAELQRTKANEQAREDVEIASRNAAREEGRDDMLTEVIQLLSSKRENDRRAKQAEKDKLKKEMAEKIRKAERELGAELERSRCMTRDEKYRKARIWSDALAFDRFETILLVEEFNKIKFGDSRPLTFEALPWPVLARTWTYASNHITADQVRAFFRTTAATSAKSAMYPVPAEYRKHLLKQGLLAFHGDKMVARISTVEDETLRQQILEAANIVTQTLNELMQRT